MISKGRKLIKQYASTLGGIEKRYGVPAEVIISIWGLETGYGRRQRQVFHHPFAGDARL